MIMNKLFYIFITFIDIYNIQKLVAHFTGTRIKNEDRHVTIFLFFWVTATFASCITTMPLVFLSVNCINIFFLAMNYNDVNYRRGLIITIGVFFFIAFVETLAALLLQKIYIPIEKLPTLITNGVKNNIPSYIAMILFVGIIQLISWKMNEKKGKFIFFISVITFIVMTAIIVFMESQWAEVQQNYVVRNTGYYLYVIMTTLFVFILEWAIKIHHLGTKRISIFHFCLTIDVLVVLYHFFFPHLITNIYAMIFIYLLVFALNFIVGRMDHVIIQNIKLYKQKLIKDAEKDVHKDQ